MAEGPLAVTGTAYVNGQFVPLADARVPVLDRGFLFGDGVYEVIPVYGGKAFRLQEHLARLNRSLGELRIDNPHDGVGWTAIVRDLLAHNGKGDRSVYIQVTRGAAEQRNHAFPIDTAPTVVALCNPLVLPDATVLRDGVGAITRPDIRWGRCDIKAIALLANVLVVQDARERSCNEAILHRDGRVTEGGSSNVYVVLGGKVVTSPEGPEILSGITRAVLLELLHKARVAVEERNPTLDELKGADEVWITSSTREVLPVTRLDGKAVGSGKPGPLWQKVHQLYQEAKKS